MNCLRKKIHKIGIATLTILNAISLMLLICAVDSFNTWTPYFVMIMNIAWLYLIAYANGGVVGSTLYYKKLRKEMRRHDN